MAFPKIPKENHALFYARIPRDPRIETKVMFGAAVGMVHGQLFGGLWGNSIMVKLSPEDTAEANKLDGTYPFDPMQTGRQMIAAVVLPDDVMEDANEMRDWLRRAFEYTATLPPKVKKTSKAKTAPKAKSAPKTTKSRTTKTQTTKKAPKTRKAPATKKPAKRR